MLARKGTVKQAKNASLILVRGGFKEECQLLLKVCNFQTHHKKIVRDLSLANSNVLASFATLNQFAKSMYDSYKESQKDVVAFIYNVLGKNSDDARSFTRTNN